MLILGTFNPVSATCCDVWYADVHCICCKTEVVICMLTSKSVVWLISWLSSVSLHSFGQYLSRHKLLKARRVLFLAVVLFVRYQYYKRLNVDASHGVSCTPATNYVFLEDKVTYVQLSLTYLPQDATLGYEVHFPHHETQVLGQFNCHLIALSNTPWY